MIRKLKKILVIAAATTGLLLPLAVPALVNAQSSAGVNSELGQNLCGGVDLSVSSTTTQCDDTNAESQVNSTIKTGLDLFSAVVGILSVVMIIIGGIKYITSGGDSGKVTSAKDSILFAVIGLVVVALAQIIVKFVLARFGTPGS